MASLDLEGLRQLCGLKLDQVISGCPKDQIRTFVEELRARKKRGEEFKNSAAENFASLEKEIDSVKSEDSQKDELFKKQQTKWVEVKTSLDANYIALEKKREEEKQRMAKKQAKEENAASREEYDEKMKVLSQKLNHLEESLERRNDEKKASEIGIAEATDNLDRAQKKKEKISSLTQDIEERFKYVEMDYNAAKEAVENQFIDIEEMKAKLEAPIEDKENGDTLFSEVTDNKKAKEDKIQAVANNIKALNSEISQASIEFDALKKISENRKDSNGYGHDAIVNAYTSMAKTFHSWQHKTSEAEAIVKVAKGFDKVDEEILCDILRITRKRNESMLSQVDSDVSQLNQVLDQVKKQHTK